MTQIPKIRRRAGTSRRNTINNHKRRKWSAKWRKRIKRLLRHTVVNRKTVLLMIGLVKLAKAIRKLFKSEADE